MLLIIEFLVLSICLIITNVLYTQRYNVSGGMVLICSTDMLNHHGTSE